MNNLLKNKDFIEELNVLIDRYTAKVEEKCKPKFKVGDTIKEIRATSKDECPAIATITKIEDDAYYSEYGRICNIDEQDKWKLYEVKRWRDDESADVCGWFLKGDEFVVKLYGKNTRSNYSLFAVYLQAKAAQAMARISQIMKNDKRFGGVVTDAEWEDKSIAKYVIARLGNELYTYKCTISYTILAFHTKEQRDLFLEENRDLVESYLMTSKKGE